MSTKMKAGKLLTGFLKQIAEEKTETIKDPKTGDDVMASKAEALARQIWRDALDHKISKIVNGEWVEAFVPRDKTMIGIILDRLEGKAPLIIDDGKKGLSTADRVTEQGKKRINDITNG